MYANTSSALRLTQKAKIVEQIKNHYNRIIKTFCGYLLFWDFPHNRIFLFSIFLCGKLNFNKRLNKTVWKIKTERERGKIAHKTCNHIWNICKMEPSKKQFIFPAAKTFFFFFRNQQNSHSLDNESLHISFFVWNCHILREVWNKFRNIPWELSYPFFCFFLNLTNHTEIFIILRKVTENDSWLCLQKSNERIVKQQLQSEKGWWEQKWKKSVRNGKRIFLEKRNYIFIGV